MSRWNFEDSKNDMLIKVALIIVAFIVIGGGIVYEKY